MSIGVIYDTVGRRKPLLLASAIACGATLVYPFNTNIVIFYIINMLFVPWNAMVQLPFIPDLIKEEG